MTDAEKQADELAELKRQLDEVKASLAPTPYDDAAMRAWQNEMHQLREKRASRQNFLTRSQLAAMDAACSKADIKDLVSHNTIPSRSAAGTSGQLGKVSSSAGIPGSNTSGWVTPAPLSNPPGTNWVDALCEVDSARQRGERMVQEARLAALKAAEKPK